MQDYAKRLKLPITGDLHTEFYTKSGTLIARGYSRIVIGGRGPYVEFSDDNIRGDKWAAFQHTDSNFHIPKGEEWRIDSNVVYYIEYRTNVDNVKVYHQKKTVDYADYKVGMYYVSPFDLMTKNGLIIEPLRKK